MTPAEGTTTPPTLKNPYQMQSREVVAQLQTDPARGLSSEEAQRRLEQYGPNQLQSKPPVPKWRKFLVQFANPLVLLLLVATVISVIAWVVEGMQMCIRDSLKDDQRRCRRGRLRSTSRVQRPCRRQANDAAADYGNVKVIFHL